MTTTTTEAPTEARRQVEQLVDWFDDRPPACRTAVDLAQLLPAVQQIVGHPVEITTLAAVYEAKVTRDLYDGSEADVDAQQKRLDVALDDLLDVTRCEACRETIPDDESRAECPHAEAPFCDMNCLLAWHGEAYGRSSCSAIGDVS